ncbi:MAG TPA: phage holin family protein [Castellaniella sp.]|uniref:phage holin family protein n=1 Tax=Castellaniella sp. TaxID=1955812 RepID=UPI002EEAC73D
MGTLGRSLAQCATQMSTLIATRLELLGLEALEARDRALCRLGVLLLAAIFLLLALLVASLAVAVAFWPTDYRIVSLGVLALVYAVLGLGLFVWLQRRLRQDPPPFAATADVLRADARSWSDLLAALGEKATPAPDSDASVTGNGAAGDKP